MYYLVEENGLKYLKSHSIPVPRFDIGETVSYTETIGGAIVTDVIEGYEICVSSYSDRDGAMCADYNIVYHFSGGEVMPEEFLDAVR